MLFLSLRWLTLHDWTGWFKKENWINKKRWLKKGFFWVQRDLIQFFSSGHEPHPCSSYPFLCLLFTSSFTLSSLLLFFCWYLMLFFFSSPPLGWREKEKSMKRERERYQTLHPFTSILDMTVIRLRPTTSIKASLQSLKESGHEVHENQEHKFSLSHQIRVNWSGGEGREGEHLSFCSRLKKKKETWWKTCLDRINRHDKLLPPSLLTSFFISVFDSQSDVSSSNKNV